jgi:hypothetical protein
MYQNWDFGFENKPSGNPGLGPSLFLVVSLTLSAFNGFPPGPTGLPDFSWYNKPKCEKI